MATDFQKQLDVAKASGVAASHKCRLNATQFGGVHLFLEDADHKMFFEPFVSAHYPGENIFTYIANGKKEVLGARETLNGKPSGSRRNIYIVDADFDPFLDGREELKNDTFETCYYSVESYFFCSEAVRYLFSNACGLDWSTEFCREIDSSLEKLKRQVPHALIHVSALSIAARNKSLVLNLNNTSPNAMFSVSRDGTLKCKRRWFRQFLRHSQLDLASLSLADVRHQRDAIRTIDPRRWVRGKYLIGIFSDFIREWFVEIRRRKEAGEKDFAKARPKVGLTVDDLLAYACGHVPCPSQFQSFLDQES